jgi:hypothetical protein
MGGREKYLDKKFMSVIEKHLTFAQVSVNKVVSLKSDHIALLLKGHHPEVVKGKCHTKKFFSS